MMFLRSRLLAILFCDIAVAYTYNGYVNHELEKDRARHLFGRRLEMSKNAKESKNNLRQRRTEGEVPTVPPMDGDDAPTDDTIQEREQQSFYQAETLEFFKKGIDPEFFEWVHPDEIAPGAWTCGFLYPDLGTSPLLVFPVIEVYVCVRFADEQPAKKGNVFTHCGGPGTLSGCNYWVALGDDVVKDYNFFTIDQRGMGRSNPTMAQEACFPGEIVKANNGTLVDVNWFEGLLNETDFADIESIKSFLEPRKKRTLNCWAASDFKLNATQEDGSINHYHFLEYSGSNQLAEDIERIRMLIHAPVMHLYGVSYGTQVFGTYATIFPGSVGLMVLDGNVNPYQNMEIIAHAQAVGEHTRISYALFSCSARNAEAPGSCPVEDLPKCVSDLNAILSKEGLQPGGLQKLLVGTVITIMLAKVDRAAEICDIAAGGDGEALMELIDELLDEVLSETSTAATKRLDLSQVPWNSESGPSHCQEGFCDIIGKPNYWELADALGTVTYLVNAEDTFSALYDSDYFARRVKEFGEFYTGSGTGTPVLIFAREWATGFNWPKGVPLAPMGSPNLTGIVAGQLYDYATPYVWTQDMRQNFPYTSLLTSQYTQHGLGGNAPECQQHVIDYFTLGDVGFVDGTVCGSDFADGSLITAAFFSK